MFTQNLQPEEEDLEPVISENLYLVGQQDADVYYPKKNTGAGGTAATVLIASPILGLIPALACSLTPPSSYNLNIPDEYPEITSDPEYLRGYIEEAHKIKRGKVWTAYSVSTLVIIVVVAIILSNY